MVVFLNDIESTKFTKYAFSSLIDTAAQISKECKSIVFIVSKNNQ